MYRVEMITKMLGAQMPLDLLINYVLIRQEIQLLTRPRICPVVRPCDEKFARWRASSSSHRAYARHVDCTLLVSTVVESTPLITFVG